MDDLTPQENELQMVKRMQESTALSDQQSPALSMIMDGYKPDPATDDWHLSDLLDIPMQVAGGFRDAAESVKNLAIDFATIPLTSGLPPADMTPGVDVKKVLKGAAKEAAALPDVPEASTTAGSIARPIAQFLAPFSVLGKTAASAKTKAAVGEGYEALARGVTADYIGFDEHTTRLSELAKEYGIETDLTDWLADRSNDSAFEARAKNALEGAGLGFAVDSVVRGAKYIKQARKVKLEASSVAAAAEPQKEAIRGMARQAVELTTDGRRTKFNFDAKYRPDKEEVLLATQKKAADAVGLTLADLKSGKVPELLASQKTRDILNAVTEVEVAAHKQFKDLTNSYAQRLAMGDKAAATEWTNDVFGEMMTIAGKSKDAFSENARALGYRGHQVEVQNINKLIQAMQGAERGRVKQIITAISELDTPQQVGGFLDGLINNADQLNKPSFSKRLHSLYLNNLLSSPTTLAVDTVGSILFTPYTALEKVPAGMIGRFRWWGNVEDRVHAVEASIALRNYVRSTMDGLKILKSSAAKGSLPDLSKVRLENATKFGLEATEPIIDPKALKLDPNSIAGRSVSALDSMLRFPSTYMRTKDDVVKAMVYRSSVEEHAVRQALNEGLSGAALNERIAKLMQSPITNVADNMESLKGDALAEFARAAGEMDLETANLALHIQRSAIQAAREVTFTKPASPLAAGAKSVVESIPGGKFIVPFIKTVDNISREGLKRTPLVLVNPNWHRTVLAGGPQADLALSRFALGSGLFTAGYFMGLDNIITGEGPKDSAEREKLLQLGWRPRSVLVGDTYVEYGRLAPLSIPFMVSANIAQMVNEYGDELPEEAAKDLSDYAVLAVQSVAQTMLSQSFATGMMDVLQALDSNSETRLKDTIENAVASLAVPNAANFIGQQLDPARKELEGVWQRIDDKWLGSDAPIKRDAFGDPITMDEKIGLFLPMSKSDTTKTPQWKVDLFMAGALPTRPQRSISVKVGDITIATNIKLTRHEHAELLEIMQTIPGNGQTLSDAFERLVGLPVFKALPDSSRTPGSAISKRDMVNMVYNSYKDLAVAELVKRHPEFMARAKSKASKEVFSPNLTKTQTVVGKHLQEILKGQKE